MRFLGGDPTINDAAVAAAQRAADQMEVSNYSAVIQQGQVILGTQGILAPPNVTYNPSLPLTTVTGFWGGTLWLTNDMLVDATIENQWFDGLHLLFSGLAYNAALSGTGGTITIEIVSGCSAQVSGTGCRIESLDITETTAAGIDLSLVNTEYWTQGDFSYAGDSPISRIGLTRFSGDVAYSHTSGSASIVEFTMVDSAPTTFSFTLVSEYASDITVALDCDFTGVTEPDWDFTGVDDTEDLVFDFTGSKMASVQLAQFIAAIEDAVTAAFGNVVPSLYLQVNDASDNALIPMETAQLDLSYLDSACVGAILVYYKPTYLYVSGGTGDFALANGRYTISGEKWVNDEDSCWEIFYDYGNGNYTWILAYNEYPPFDPEEQDFAQCENGSSPLHYWYGTYTNYGATGTIVVTQIAPS
jgi:hypothetical protein